jgi:CubicO group peptidase (beta-lactamase class C family)
MPRLKWQEDFDMTLQGNVHPDFGPVAERLISLLPKKGPGGAALCIYHHGEKVVDIWAGSKDFDHNPWQADTLAFSASTTKGVASTVLHILADRGMVDYDDRIAQHWPEFGQNGKQDITVRQLMSHQAGLYSIVDIGIKLEHLWDWPAALRQIEQARPVHEPGLHSAYHGLTYGHILGGLIEKLTGQGFQQVLHTTLTEPLQLDGCYVGVPDTELARMAELISYGGRLGSALNAWRKLPPPLRWVLHRLGLLAGLDFTHFARALSPLYIRGLDFNDPAMSQAIIPSANGVFTARSLARIYATLANGGELEGVRLLSSDRIAMLQQRQSSGKDLVLNLPMRWRLGYHQAFAMGAKLPRSFGHFGFGGSGAWCDPDLNLAVAMTLNTGVGTPTGDLRILRINGDAVRCALQRQGDQAVNGVVTDAAPG